MKLNIAQVIGLNTDQKAAQVIFTPSGEENAYLAVLDLACDDAFTKGRQILSELSDFYFDFEGTPAEKLKATYEKAKEKFTGEEYSLLVASISGKILYLISKGNVEVHLRRAEKVSALASVGSDSQLISGFLQPADRLILSTESLVNFLGEDLEKSLSLPLDTFEEEVSDRIGASDLENQGLAGLALEVEQELEQAGEEVEKENIPNLQQEQLSNQSQSDYSSYSSDTPRSNKLLAIPFKIGSIIKTGFKNYFPKSGRSKLILAIILIAALGAGIGYKIISSKNAQTEAEYNQFLQQSRDDFNKAKALASLNPAEAKTKLESAKEKVDKAISLKPKSAEALDFKKQIESESDSILKQSELSDFPVFLDMDLVKKNFRAQSLSMSSGKLLLLDSAVGTLAMVDIAKKSNQILAGSEQLGEAKYASLNGTTAVVYSDDKGILKIDTTNQKVTTVAKKDETIPGVEDIYGFASNIYLTDSKMIWKYLATSTGFSDKREYLTKGTTVDLASVLRMQIESSVYILKKGGEILRFTKGEKDNFGLEGLPSAVKDPKSIFVSSDTDNLYVLDSGNSRLLVLSKTGTYKSQITGAKFGSASDLVVDEKEKKVYLLEGSKIYLVDLK